MNLKAMLDDVRANLHAPVPKLRAALTILDNIEAIHCAAPVPAEVDAAIEAATGDLVTMALADGVESAAVSGTVVEVDDKPGKKKNW